MKELIVAVTGASGSLLGFRLLEALKGQPEKVKIHLILSDGAKRTIKEETCLSAEQFEALADEVYSENELDATISSGSVYTDGMIIVPCSMKTLSAVANGYDENLVVRAADVCLKEDRKVVLVPREMPLNQSYIRNMLSCAEYGCRIIPPMLTFYNEAHTLEEQMDHVIGKILMQFGMRYDRFRPWERKDSAE